MAGWLPHDSIDNEFNGLVHQRMDQPSDKKVIYKVHTLVKMFQRFAWHEAGQAEERKYMSKKNKATTPPANAVAGTAEPGTPAAPAKAKVKKTKVQVPLTDAQKAAQEALDKANAQAREELLANSKEKIEKADAKIAACEEALKVARAERKAINVALGVKGTFGGKKCNKLTYVKDFPEGKGAPQAKAILEIVKAGGKDGVAREKVVETMKTAINTKMDRSRLLSYYASRMADAGVVKLD